MSQTRRLTDELVRIATREVGDAGPIPGFDHFSEADYDKHLDAFLRDRPEGPLHVFAYGSLIWKPVYEPAAAQRAAAPGWHRAFCLKVARFRGTIERPGLMMQLHPGDGGAEGVLHQLDRTTRSRRSTFAEGISEAGVRTGENQPRSTGTTDDAEHIAR